MPSRRTALFLLASAVLLLGLAIRLPDVGATCNVDGILYWFGRTKRFWEALDSGRWERTYQSPHPGVMVMWISGAALRVAGVLEAPIGPLSVTAATLPLAVLGSVVPAATLPLVYRLSRDPDAAAPGRALDREAAWLATLTAVLLATEPFLVAHSRTFHLDATATGFVWLGALCGTLAFVERRFVWAVAAGTLFGLAALTRLFSVAFALGLALACIGTFVVERPRTTRLPLLVATMGASAMLVSWLLWPALWTAPVKTLRRALESGARVAGSGHAVLSWGKVYERDPGIAHYAGILLMRLSPEVLGAALFSWLGLRRARSRTWRTLAVLACTYVPATMVLLASPKKGDRYLLPLFPFLAFLAARGALELTRRLRLPERFARQRPRLLWGVLALLLAGRCARLARVHPLPITWCASYPGLSPERVITLGQGEGFRAAARWIAAQSPRRTPTVLSAYARGVVMTPWLHFRRARRGDDADFVVTYLSSEQRGLDAGVNRFAVGKPAHEIRFEGRTYVRIYPGPRRRRGRSRD